MRKTLLRMNSRVEPSIFFVKKKSFSLKLSSNPGPGPREPSTDSILLRARADPGFLERGYILLLWAVFLGYNHYWPDEFMVFVVLCPGASESSTGSGSGFKASQKTGPRFKVSSDRLGEPRRFICLKVWKARFDDYIISHDYEINLVSLRPKELSCLGRFYALTGHLFISFSKDSYIRGRGAEREVQANPLNLLRIRH